MNPTLLAALTLVAAVGLTYLFGVRPMLKGRCAASSRPAGAAEQQAEIEAARAQFNALRAGHLAADDGRGQSRD